MKPLNIPELLDLGREFSRRVGYDFASQVTRIHAAAGRAAYHAPTLPIEESYLYAAMAEILNLAGAQGWHLGVIMAEHVPADRSRRPLDYIAEALSMVGLAYGSYVAVPEEREQPALYLGLAFRLLLTLCEESGFEPADGLARWYHGFY